MMLFKIVETEDSDNQGIRKMALTNVLITRSNLFRMLQRLRDKNSEIQLIVLRKLISQKMILEENYENFTLNQVYKIL